MFSTSFSHHWKLQCCGDIVRKRSNCLSDTQGKCHKIIDKITRLIHTGTDRPVIVALCIRSAESEMTKLICHSACGLHLRGTCCTCPPWERSWPTTRMTPTPGWSAISLWITTMHRWAIGSRQTQAGNASRLQLLQCSFIILRPVTLSTANQQVCPCQNQHRHDLPDPG